MKIHRFNRKTPLIVLFLVVALALVLAGAYRGSTNEASAAAPSSIPDITAPISLRASLWTPADGATGVAIDASVTVKFSMDIKTANLDDNFTIKKAGAASNLAANATYNSTTNICTLNPDFNLLAGTTYEVTLDGAIQSTGGLPLTNEGTWSFTTDTAPEIAARTPTSGATGVPTSQVVSVTFNRDMKPATITSASFTLKKEGEAFALATTVAYDADTKTATLTPSDVLHNTTTYVVTLTSTIKSEAALSLAGAPVAWSFTTAAAAPPTVTAKVPADQATDRQLNQVVSATFDKNMDAATITTTSFNIRESGAAMSLAATVAYNAGTRTATLTPSADLEPDTYYDVTLTTAVKGSDGQTLSGAPVTWSFLTMGTAPSVIAKVPAHQAVDRPLNQVVSATFDKNMNAATITNTSFNIRESGAAMSLAATVAYNPATKTATLTPSAALEADTFYDVTLTTAVEDSDGLSLAGAPVTWGFRTVEGSSAITFPDVAGSPYETAIYELAGREIISGYVDGTFGPNNLVLRKHFAKMIVGTMGLPVSEADWQDASRPFTDCGADDLTDIYPHDFIAVAKEAGLTAGKTPTTFAPNDNITHQQLITMVVRAAGLADPPIGYLAPFTAAQFSTTEHYQNALKAGAAGLLAGLQGIGPSYNFLAGSTRGECAQILYNLIGLLEL